MNPEDLKNSIDGLKYIESLRMSNYYLLFYSFGATIIIGKLILMYLKLNAERFKDKDTRILALEAENALLKEIKKIKHEV
jgi:hypothetical protein